MSEQDLNRAKEIQEEISYLQSSLSQLNTAKFFECDEGSRGYGRKADSFLSELHIKMKKDAVFTITTRVKLLEKEFKSL